MTMLAEAVVQCEAHQEQFKEALQKFREFSRGDIMEFMKEQFRSGTKYGRDDDYTKGIAGEDGALFKSFCQPFKYVVQTKTLARLLNQLNMCDFVIRTCLLVVCACSAVGILLAARADAEDRISTGKSWN